MSSRSPLWELAVRGIQKRPLFGWGFNGFGIAYPFVANPNKVPEIVNLGQFSYDYMAPNGRVRTEKIPSYKAHNWILDTAISTGILGAIASFALWGYCLHARDRVAKYRFISSGDRLFNFHSALV
nr:O-antigen ligase family protein [Tychonema sp. LEGE 06208]